MLVENSEKINELSEMAMFREVFGWTAGASVFAFTVRGVFGFTELNNEARLAFLDSHVNSNSLRFE